MCVCVSVDEGEQSTLSSLIITSAVGASLTYALTHSLIHHYIRIGVLMFVLQVATFLRRELPIRLAHRIQDLSRVPYMKDMVSVIGVRQLYTQSFSEITSFQQSINDPKTEEEFARLIETIYERHSAVLVQMAKGAYEMRHAIHEGRIELAKDPDGSIHESEELDGTDAFLDRFYLCRIGIRVLIGQYLALRQPPMENYVGLICSQTSPYEIVKRAIDDAAFVCTRKYGDAPDVLITGKLEQTFPYVPTHLRKCHKSTE